MNNPSFKDLLSKDMQQAIKGLSQSKGDEAGNSEKPTTPTPLPSQKQVSSQVKRFNHDGIDEDKVLFMQAMAGVAPIKQNTHHNTSQKAKDDPTALFRRANAEGVIDENSHSLSDMQALLNPVASEAMLSYKHPTLQNKVFEQLKQGKLRWYDAVDLHGSSIEDARLAVTKIISNASKNGETVIKIVHGKGNDAIIKTCVNGWLRQIDEVMAFASAPAKDGGNGAVLVLLKKNRVL
ncbi:MAG: Smr/MutS family protein [Moraxella sp.]|nr:Smr/MutS family protein [Moraxella sp.]